MMKKLFKIFIRGRKVPENENDEVALTKLFFGFKNWYCKNIARYGTGGPKGVTKWMVRKWIEKYNLGKL